MKYLNARLLALFLVASIIILGACQNPKPQIKTRSEPNVSNNDFGFSEFEGLIEEYENTERVIWQKPDLVISLIDDIERKTVVDLGAGSGYFAFRLAGRAKKVIAVDIDERWVAFMDTIKYNQLTPSRLARFEARISFEDAPNLKIAEVDDILVVNTYCYINNRIIYFSNAIKHFKPQGRLTIVDFKPNNMPVGPTQEKKLSTFEVTQELQEAGYNIVSVDETSLQYQYIIIAEPKY